MKRSTRWSRLPRFIRNCRWSWRRAVDSWIENNVIADEYTQADVMIKQIRWMETHQEPGAL